MTPQTISDQTWAGIRNEFTLPTLAQVHRRLSELMEDPEPLMRQLVRIFLSGLRTLSQSSSCQCQLSTNHPRLGSSHGADLEVTLSFGDLA